MSTRLCRTGRLSPTSPDLGEVGRRSQLDSWVLHPRQFTPIPIPTSRSTGHHPTHSASHSGQAGLRPTTICCRRDNGRVGAAYPLSCRGRHFRGCRFRIGSGRQDDGPKEYPSATEHVGQLSPTWSSSIVPWSGTRRHDPRNAISWLLNFAASGARQCGMPSDCSAPFRLEY